MNLSDLKSGDKATILSINGDEKLKKRLFALGCLKGTLVELVNKAPLGDPLILSFRGATLALRKKDAINIIIERIDN